MSENTKERSLEKLFGTSRNVREAPDGAEGQTPPAEAEVPAGTASQSTRKRSSQTQASAKQSKQTAKSKAPINSDLATSSGSEEEEDVGPGGYLGKSRYKRGDGVLVKPSIYVRPDQAHALRMSAAAKDDPNGETMSEIIQSLLDQNGYCDSKHRP